MKRLFVKYEFVSGEDTCCANTIISREDWQSDEQAIHSYFKNFWGSSTEVESKARIYYGNGGTVAVKILGWQVCPKEDYRVLSKYGI